MALDIRHGMVPIESAPGSSAAVGCADPLCGRFILPGEPCFIDTLDGGKVYCDSCGKCIRYERKMEEKHPDEDTGV